MGHCDKDSRKGTVEDRGYLDRTQKALADLNKHRTHEQGRTETADKTGHERQCRPGVKT